MISTLALDLAGLDEERPRKHEQNPEIARDFAILSAVFAAANSE
jgi:hypothetical protein